MFAFVFESVGGGEWLVLLAVVLIAVGPKNLPAAARKMGQTMNKLRRAADEFKRQLLTMDEEMKRSVEDIKREYIDTPELAPGGEPHDGAGGDFDDGSCEGADNEFEDDDGQDSPEEEEEEETEQETDGRHGGIPADTERS